MRKCMLRANEYLGILPANYRFLRTSYVVARYLPLVTFRNIRLQRHSSIYKWRTPITWVFILMQIFDIPYALPYERIAFLFGRWGQEAARWVIFRMLLGRIIDR